MFELERDYVLINDEEFDIVRERHTGKTYFADRIALRGRLNFGYVGQGQEAKISLTDNAINSSIIIDSIVAIANNSTSDEILIKFYTNSDFGKILSGQFRYSSDQMPIDFPDGIIDPGITIGVTPVRADATITVYVKPVVVLFDAITNPVVIGGEGGEGGEGGQVN